MSLRRKLMMRLGAQIRRQVEIGRDLFTEVIPEAQRGTIFMLERDWTKADVPVDAFSDLNENSRWQVLLADYWSINGFPVLAPSHRLCASLMATTIPAEHVPEVIVPWDTFAIAIPGGVLEDDICHVMLHRDPGRRHGAEYEFSILAQLEGSGRLYMWGSNSFGEMPRCRNQVTGRDEWLDRIGQLIGRLALGLCIEIDKPKLRAEIGNGPRRRSVRHQR